MSSPFGRGRPSSTTCAYSRWGASPARWLVTIFLAFPLWFVLAEWNLLELCYAKGEPTTVGGRTVVICDGIIYLINNQTHATWWYWINFFIAWVLKLILLSYGGVKAYMAGKLFFYGVGIAYAIGPKLSSVVDMVWFASSVHWVHGW